MLLPNSMILIKASDLEEMTHLERLGGKDRYATAAIVSETAYPDGSNNVILAGHNGEVDALSGTLLAA